MSNIEISVPSSREAIELSNLLKEHDVQFSEEFYVQKSADVEGVFKLILEHPELPISLITAIGGWIAGRQGRRCSIKTPYIEAEANSVEDLQKIINMGTDRPTETPSKKGEEK